MTDRAARKRKPSLSSALTQALKAGVVPTGATIAPDGSVSLNFGRYDEIENNANGNPWDEVLTNAQNQKRPS